MGLLWIETDTPAASVGRVELLLFLLLGEAIEVEPAAMLLFEPLAKESDTSLLGFLCEPFLNALKVLRNVMAINVLLRCYYDLCRLNV